LKLKKNGRLKILDIILGIIFGGGIPFGTLFVFLVVIS